MKRYICTKQQWMSPSGLKGKVYGVIKTSGDVGSNRREIADAISLNVGRVSSYLAELKREGLVKRLGDAIDPATLSPEDATLHAMAMMENAIISVASSKGITSEVARAFATYQKCKGLAIGRGTTENEAKTAMRMAMLNLVKLVY